MSDLTDERLGELASWISGQGMPDIHNALRELQRHRAAVAADEERVRSVVAEGVRESLVRFAQFALRDDAFDLVIGRSSARAAKQLATAAVGLTPDEIAQLRHHIDDHKATCSYSCSLIERLLDAADQSLAARRAYDERTGTTRHTVPASTAAGLSEDERADLDALLGSLREHRDAAIQIGRSEEADVLRDQHVALTKLLATVSP